MDKTSDEFRILSNDVQQHREHHWLSVFHQLTIPVCLEDVYSVCEFGPGRGFLGAALKFYGIEYCCADVVDYGAKPDYLCDIMSFPEDKTFDLVCAFQTLEHNPPETFVPHLLKMASVSNKYVYISLPYFGRWFSMNLSINLPKLRGNFSKTFTMDRMNKKRPLEEYRKSKTPFNHHWFEVGDKGFKKKDLIRHAMSANLMVVEMKHSQSFPYHYFILMEKI